MTNTDPQADSIAAQVLSAHDSHSQIAPFTDGTAAFDLPAAYRVTAALRRLRMARDARPVGRKIGFTNRILWDEYGVRAPIWGDMFDTTVSEVSATPVPLGPYTEPKIEPEIVFSLARAPQPDMDEGALLTCIDWAAQGFEVVHSIYPGWRFQAADTVAGLGMHGALIIGERHPAEGLTQAALEGLSVTLVRDGAEVEDGHAANVLGGPLTALRHLVELLAEDDANPPLVAGEIVTTGSLTRAHDIAPGQTWRTKIGGIKLPDIEVSFR